MKELPLIAPDETKVLDLAHETRFADNGIVSRNLLTTGHSRTILFGFTEGQELSEHTSTQHALIQVLSGECHFTLPCNPHTLKAGAFLHLPPNLPHAVRAHQPFSMLITLVKPTHKPESGGGEGHC
ncbi:MAG: cupin domain-containing protein [Verrucomicrobiae bacterium]|nr:cupin domain-containing protein [Verrucomicrobiae bacterium]